MKRSRSLLLWATLALCAAMVLGAMTWLTRGVLASEKERAIAEARADLEEYTRLALWRLDAAGAAIVSSENYLPTTAYQPGSTAFLTSNDPVTKLHFELREKGNLTSPEVDGTRERLDALRKLLGANPIPGLDLDLLNKAVETSESTWNATPKDAPQEKKENAIQRKASRSEIRSDASYQSNLSGVEKAKRAKNVEDTVANAYAPAADATAMAQVSDEFTVRQRPTLQPTDVGAMRAVWIGDELFLLRQFSTATSGRLEKGVQGVWIDHKILTQRLLAGITDLLPSAQLTRATNAAQDPLALVSFPFRLVRNEALPIPRTSITGALAVGWGAVILALITASLLVRGVMRLSERRASFVSAVTHELRTPLTTFRLYSDMLASDAVKPEKRGDYLRVLSREADRLAHLVENVLSFSQIERGSARSVVVETDISSLLESLRERFEARLASAGMTLEMNITSGHRVRVDTAAVEHILFNLIDNAAKYAAGSEPPTVIIHVEAAARNLQIIVSDHGPGIPHQERRRIFQAFHKSAREAAESRPGVGLGLALSRRLAKSLGGSLDCVDAKSGARFTLQLPLA